MSASRALDRRLAKTPASKNQHSDTKAAASVDLRARTARRLAPPSRDLRKRQPRHASRPFFVCSERPTRELADYRFTARAPYSRSPAASRAFSGSGNDFMESTL